MTKPLIELMAMSGRTLSVPAGVNAGPGGYLSSTNSGITGLIFRNNGICSKTENGTASYHFDWISPTSSYDPLYEVRAISYNWVLPAVGGTFYVEAAAEDTWIALDSDRQWGVADTIPTGGGAQEVGVQFQIRYNGGAVLDTSGIYWLMADYETG